MILIEGFEELLTISIDPFTFFAVSKDQIGDDDCVGRINMLRFDAGSSEGQARDAITIIRLTGMNAEHSTRNFNLRQPLYHAYTEGSMIKLHIRSCKASESNFKGFSVLARRSRVVA